MAIDLNDFPEFRVLRALVDQQAKEILALKQCNLQWVNTEQAIQITGLCARSLFSARKSAGSLIVWKDDHGLRYDYDSLLRHNESRAIGRGRLRQSLLPSSLGTT